MTEAASSRLALVLDAPLGDLRPVVAAAVASGRIDRSAPLGRDPAIACEVHWGGRMQRAAARAMTDDDGVPLLRTETVVTQDGWLGGTARQAALLAALAEALAAAGASATAVRDLSARRPLPLDWLGRAAEGRLEVDDVVDVRVLEDAGVAWLFTHGLARHGVPDLELYGVAPAAVPAAVEAVLRVASQLLGGGLGAALTSAHGTPLRLVPVLTVWRRLPLTWPGVARSGQERGPGLDGPRATLSVLHRPRLGAHRLDLEGVVREFGVTSG